MIRSLLGVRAGVVRQLPRMRAFGPAAKALAHPAVAWGDPVRLGVPMLGGDRWAASPARGFHSVAGLANMQFPRNTRIFVGRHSLGPFQSAVLHPALGKRAFHISRHALDKPKPKKPANTLEHHLAQVKGLWGRLAVRTKWALIKNYRPFNFDEIGAFFSWIIWGHILWILLGTTTFISLIVWTTSQTRTQDVLARWVGRLVTKETGLRVVFEQAIVPDWKAGAIVLHKVFIQRRPGTHSNVALGSQKEAATSTHAQQLDEGNYTQCDLTVDEIAVTLSLKRWLSGRGILETVEARGVRGVVDRRFVQFDPLFDPTKHRKKHKRGDFDWETTKIEDLVITVLQPDHQRANIEYATQVRQLREQGLSPVEIQREMRKALPGIKERCCGRAGMPPFEFCLINCELSRLRMQWLFIDMLNANYVSGSFDGAMFSMHKRQLPTEVQVKGVGRPERAKPAFRKVQRLRIDNVDIRHFNRGVTGMFGWIESGSCDFLADIMLPDHDVTMTTAEEFQDLLERWGQQAKQIWTYGKPGEVTTQVERDMLQREARKTIAIDLRVQFNNPRASAPLFTPDLTYLNNAIIHPIVAYINSRDTYIPVHCHVAKRLYDFDGSWTVYDSGLMGDLSSEIYRAFARNAQDDEERSRRIKKVGFWSLQFMAQLVLLTLGIVA